ncbi:unnamed protein product, partial [Prorocentrum cordatum]
GLRVSFDLDACVVHDVVPYAEVYGVHPRDFVFGRRYYILRTASPRTASSSRARTRRRRPREGEAMLQAMHAEARTGAGPPAGGHPRGAPRRPPATALLARAGPSPGGAPRVLSALVCFSALPVVVPLLSRGGSVIRRWGSPEPSNVAPARLSFVLKAQCMQKSSLSPSTTRS